MGQRRLRRKSLRHGPEPEAQRHHPGRHGQGPLFLLFRNSGPEGQHRPLQLPPLQCPHQYRRRHFQEPELQGGYPGRARQPLHTGLPLGRFGCRRNGGGLVLHRPPGRPDAPLPARKMGRILHRRHRQQPGFPQQPAGGTLRIRQQANPQLHRHAHGLAHLGNPLGQGPSGQGQRLLRLP